MGRNPRSRYRNQRSRWSEIPTQPWETLRQKLLGHELEGYARKQVAKVTLLHPDSFAFELENILIRLHMDVLEVQSQELAKRAEEGVEGAMDAYKAVLSRLNLLRRRSK